MHIIIYLPSAGLLPKRLVRDPILQVLGYRLQNNYVVMDYLPLGSPDLCLLDPELRLLGYLTGFDSTTCIEKLPTLDFNLRYKRHSEYPSVEMELDRSADSFTIVVFSPPKLRNLEYFTVYPVLLQGSENECQNDELHKQIDRSRRYRNFKHSVCIADEKVLERINNCLEVRQLLQNSLNRPQKNQFGILRGTESFLRIVRYPISIFLKFLITQALSVLVCLISILNSNVKGIVPVEVSSVCRQLDLRLRQLSFLPIQFLCYYKGDVLSSQARKILKLSFPNENHNIKNSNYINFYNNLWLIINDMFLGRFIFNLWNEHHGFFLELVQKYRHCAFVELAKLISWIGTDNPAGFKLNNDLGQFMEAMLIWTSLTWQMITELNSHIYHSAPVISCLARLTFRLLCTFGLSFIIAYLVDYVRFIGLHVWIFNVATSKIYHQQIETLKSLLQLFRGKKYNVLRSRIDSIDEDDYQIDQLLLGTFCFMILTYLLPTMFAFHFLFFIAYVCLLTLTKLGEKLIVILNFFPIFIIMLKLKNSRRLQGGIYFVFKGNDSKTNWIIMRNKALTLDNIIGPFATVLHQQGRILRFFLNFIEGKKVEVQNCTLMKFRYLMLPEDYSKLVEVWQSIR